MQAATNELVPLDAVAADSPHESCRRVSISRSTFYDAVKQGRLKVAKIGRRTVVPRGEIMRVLAALDAGTAI